MQATSYVFLATVSQNQQKPEKFTNLCFSQKSNVCNVRGVEGIVEEISLTERKPDALN